ncbi:MAG: ParB/RepB/Spo0J family partition protein [Thermodesulfobacteriota bacterium]
MVDMKSIQKIPLDQIDLSDETFSVNFRPDLQRLRSSIEEIGLIQPVLLRERADRYQIVSGFRRISVFRELCRPGIEAKIFPEKEMEDLGFFLISLHENLTTRGYNAVEKAMALDKLVHSFYVDSVAMVNTFLPFFSLESHEKILKTYLSLARMEEEVKDYVLREEVSRSNIRILSRFDPEDRKGLVSLFSLLKLGENRLREMLTLIEEISRRDRVRVRDMVRRPEIERILCQKELTASQRTERVKRALIDLRYPRMRQKEEGFEKKRRDLHLSSALSLHHQPFFEGRGLRMEFQFETIEEYRAILSTLSGLPEEKAFQEMIEGVTS